MTNFVPAQHRLLSCGYDIGAVDGIAGTRTWAGILAFVVQRPLSALLPFGEAAAVYLPRYGIDQTVDRVANFVGQAAHESGDFRFMREIWGPTAAQRGYEGRADLGNIRPGDGRRYLGRGIFQLTGRANYRAAGDALGLDLEANPELVESPAVAVQTATWFWRTRNLNVLADAGEDDRITRRINGGTNGIAERRQRVARARGLFA